MGSEMSGFVDAVSSWSEAGVVLSLFLVGPLESVSRPPVVAGSVKVVSYYLEDPDRDLGPLEVYEHDLRFGVVPDDLERIVGLWLAAGIDGGAEVAWFGFEGSFHFEHLLTQDIADAVYGVADRTGVYLALDDARRESDEWAQQIRGCRQQLIT
jgi:hypothetical protein